METRNSQNIPDNFKRCIKGHKMIIESDGKDYRKLKCSNKNCSYRIELKKEGVK